MSEELKELAYKNRWIINNRWANEAYQVDASQVADRLVALATGQQIDTDSTLSSESTVDVESYGTFEPPEWQVKVEPFPIVGRRFTRDSFIKYVRWVKDNETYTWAPSGITMHHTGYPDLTMRPNGFTEQHMLNIRHGYFTQRGWNRGPHIFTDDNGIWVFNPLSARGVHAVFFNNTRYGIEMLGNFDDLDEFRNPRGETARSNGMFAAATLMRYAGISSAKLNFHRHDPETDKKCPGKHVDFSAFEDEVLSILVTL